MGNLPGPPPAGERYIYDFTVEELPGGGLRAVHVTDPAIVVRAEFWEDLRLDCMVASTLRTWRIADERRERERLEARS